MDKRCNAGVKDGTTGRSKHVQGRLTLALRALRIPSWRASLRATRRTRKASVSRSSAVMARGASGSTGAGSGMAAWGSRITWTLERSGA